VLAPATDALLTVSASVKDDLVRLRVAPGDRVRVMPLGLDLDPLAGTLPKGLLRQEAGWADEARIVGIVGRLVPIKDVDNFIDAASILAKEVNGVRFAVVGDGEERERLEGRALSLLGDRIRFFGWRKDTAPVYGDLEVVVNTSLNEGTPVTLIEALAAGRHVVATAVGGTPDVLEAGRFGTLVPPRAPRQTARAIASALELGGGSERSVEGQNTVLERYSVGRLLGDMAELYRELLMTVPRER
jgi:glycosyltransferase involved in cell wall biosynthesis